MGICGLNVPYILMIGVCKLTHECVKFFSFPLYGNCAKIIHHVIGTANIFQPTHPFLKKKHAQKWMTPKHMLKAFLQMLCYFVLLF